MNYVELRLLNMDVWDYIRQVVMLSYFKKSTLIFLLGFTIVFNGYAQPNPCTSPPCTGGTGNGTGGNGNGKCPTCNPVPISGIEILILGGIALGAYRIVRVNKRKKTEIT